MSRLVLPSNAVSEKKSINSGQTETGKEARDKDSLCPSSDSLFMSRDELLQCLALSVQDAHDFQRQPLSKLLLGRLSLVTRLYDPLPCLPDLLFLGERLGSLQHFGPFPPSDDPYLRGRQLECFVEDREWGRSSLELELGEHRRDVRVGTREFAILHDQPREVVQRLMVRVHRGRGAV